MTFLITSHLKQIFFPRSFTSEAGYTARIATPPTTPALPTSRPITPKSVVMDFNHTLRHPLSDPDITTHVSVSARVRNFRSLDLETASSCGVPPYDYFEGAYPAVRRSVSIPPPQLRRMSSLHPYVRPCSFTVRNNVLISYVSSNRSPLSHLLLVSFLVRNLCGG